MTDTNTPPGTQQAITEAVGALKEIGRLTEQVQELLASLPARVPEPVPEPEPDLLTMEETAQRLRISISFVKKLVAAGDLTVERFGRRVLVPAEEVDRYRTAHRDAA